MASVQETSNKFKSEQEYKSTAIKFSDHIESLQQINRMRKAPVAAQIKRVIDLLQENVQALKPEQINQECYVDLSSNKEVFDSLRNNPKVYYDGERFSYKPKQDLRNKDKLLALVRHSPDGIAVDDLKDACNNVMEDLKSLEAEGQIWLVSKDQHIAYPNDPMVRIKVDDDLKELFKGIKLPRDMIGIEEYLKKNGMKPSTNTAERRTMSQVHGIIAPKAKAKKKKHGISKRTKLTNAYLPEPFFKKP